MPRPKYRITEEDYADAWQYLARRVRTFDIEFAEDAVDPEGDFRNAGGFSTPEALVEGLNDWCEKHLSSDEWTKLKSAIRKRRERHERYHDLTTITISVKAHELLVKLSLRDNVTLSEVLERYLAKAWKAAPATRRRKRRS